MYVFRSHSQRPQSQGSKPRCILRSTPTAPFLPKSYEHRIPWTPRCEPCRLNCSWTTPRVKSSPAPTQKCISSFLPAPKTCAFPPIRCCSAPPACRWTPSIVNGASNSRALFRAATSAIQSRCCRDSHPTKRSCSIPRIPSPMVCKCASQCLTPRNLHPAPHPRPMERPDDGREPVTVLRACVARHTTDAGRLFICARVQDSQERTARGRLQGSWRLEACGTCGLAGARCLVGDFPRSHS